MTTAVRVFASAAFCWRWEGADLDRRMPRPGAPVLLLVPAESTTIRQWRLPAGESDPRAAVLLQAEQALAGGLAEWEIALEVVRHPDHTEVLLTAIQRDFLEPVLAMLAASQWRLVGLATPPALWSGLAPLHGAVRLRVPGHGQAAVREGRVTGWTSGQALLERWRVPAPQDAQALDLHPLPSLPVEELVAQAALAAHARGVLPRFDGVLRRAERAPASRRALVAAGAATVLVAGLALTTSLLWLRHQEAGTAALADRAAQIERQAAVSRSLAREVGETRRLLDAFTALQERRGAMDRLLRVVLDALPAAVRITGCSAGADGSLTIDAEATGDDAPLQFLDLLRQATGRVPELEHLQRVEGGTVRFRLAIAVAAAPAEPTSSSTTDAPAAGGADAHL